MLCGPGHHFFEPFETIYVRHMDDWSMATVYDDPQARIALPNPLTADSNGRLPRFFFDENRAIGLYTENFDPPTD